MKKIAIIGGGTFSHVRSHLALAAPAFGTTAREIYEIIQSQSDCEANLYLTAMAGGSRSLVTNDDVSSLLDGIVSEGMDVIFMNAAMCDYDGTIGDVRSDKYAERLVTSEDTAVEMKLTPAEKVISKIRLANNEVYLVGFKTTTGATVHEQFIKGLRMMKSTKCNLVLANDTKTRKNIVITPEETYYEYSDRVGAIRDLIHIALSRSGATYNHTAHVQEDNYKFEDLHDSLKTVLRYLIVRGAFICNNGNGFTPGHFCERIGESSFVSSQRKANHNDVEKNGLTRIEVVGDGDMAVFTAHGDKKASVGARSQWMLLRENVGYDFIVHTHSPLRAGSVLEATAREQKPFQCGSLECGLNTLSGLVDCGNGIKAVMLKKHGPNILFKKDTPVNELIDFMESNFVLDVKTT